jgi:hypothetical protein
MLTTGRRYLFLTFFYHDCNYFMNTALLFRNRMIRQYLTSPHQHSLSRELYVTPLHMERVVISSNLEKM